MEKRIHIMGIVNLTPDSFYPESRVMEADAMARIEQLFRDGAHVVDLGACSTRPGGVQPSEEEEWKRLKPVLERIGREIPFSGTFARIGSRSDVEEKGISLPVLSIDTYRSEIVRWAYELIGPFIVNDVGGGEPQMLQTVGELGLPYIAMHGRVPKGDVVEDVLAFFRDFAIKAREYGVKEWMLDPGFGFGKDTPQNYELLRRLDELKAAGREILVGISRKSMIYKTLGITPEEAMPVSLSLEALALERGATWLRVHDVKETARMVKAYSTMYTSSPGAAK